MATLTIRNLDEEVKRALRRRAADHGVSMEQEVRTILREVALKKLSAPAAPGTWRPTGAMARYRRAGGTATLTGPLTPER